MTREERERVKALIAVDASDAMHSGCTDYACYCHFELPKVHAYLEAAEAERDQWKNYAEQMVMLRDLATQERDQLRARAERLEAALREAVSKEHWPSIEAAEACPRGTGCGGAEGGVS